MCSNSKSAKKKLKIVLFYCRNCVSNDKDINILAAKTENFSVRPAVLPCSSKIQAQTILKILDKEADGVEIAACPEGKCHFLVGSRRTKRRVEYVQKLLNEIGVNPDCVGITQRADLSCDDLIELAKHRAGAISTVTKEYHHEAHEIHEE